MPGLPGGRRPTGGGTVPRGGGRANPLNPSLRGRATNTASLSLLELQSDHYEQGSRLGFSRAGWLFFWARVSGQHRARTPPPRGRLRECPPGRSGPPPLLRCVSHPTSTSQPPFLSSTLDHPHVSSLLWRCVLHSEVKEEARRSRAGGHERRRAHRRSKPARSRSERLYAATPCRRNTSAHAASLRSNDQLAFAGLVDGNLYTGSPNADVCLACR